MNKLRVLFLAEQLIPSSVIGVVKPFLELQKENKLDFKIRYTRHYKESDIIACDIIVLCRNIDPGDLNILELAKKHNKKIIYDIDDNFFELSVDSPIGRYHRHPMHLYVLTQMLENADAVRVYSHPMKEIADRFNQNAFLVKSYFDFSLISGCTPARHDKIRIVYATSRGKNDTLAKIYLPAVARILQEFEDKVEFYAYGQIPDELKGFKNTVKLKYEHNYSKYIRSFYSYGFDIGLAPLLNDRFHNSKTNNKFREYGAMGVCGVYSDAPIYSECVEHGKNGMLVDNSAESWYNAVRELIVNDELRADIRANALESVRKHYSMQNTLNDWERILGSLKAPQTDFHSILKLDIAVAVDSSYPYTNPRLDPLFTVLGFIGIHYNVIDTNKMKQKDICDTDLVICFVNNNRDIEFLADKFAALGKKELIFDTMLPFGEPEKYPHIMFTNSEKTDAPNVFPIDFKCNFDGINLFQYTDFLTFSKDSGLKTDYVSEYCRGIDKVRQYLGEFYSEDNPQFLWAMLLQRYKGSYSAPSVIGRAGNKFCRLFGRISAKLDPVFKKFSNFMNRCAFFIRKNLDYFRINFLKKY